MRPDLSIPIMRYRSEHTSFALTRTQFRSLAHTATSNLCAVFRIDGCPDTARLSAAVAQLTAHCRPLSYLLVETEQGPRWVSGTPLRGGIEQRIAAIGQTLLRVADIGRDDSFFGLGGDSILVVRMQAQLRNTFGLQFPMAAFYPRADHRDTRGWCSREHD
jgi:acyl carrier protein